MKIFAYILAGLFSGVLGGMGMGGGTLLIPILTIFLSVAQHQAQGINLLSFIPMSIVALIFHIKNKLVKKEKLWVIILPSILFAVLGSLLAKIVPAEILSRIFGGFLIALSFVQFFAKT